MKTIVLADRRSPFNPPVTDARKGPSRGRHALVASDDGDPEETLNTNLTATALAPRPAGTIESRLVDLLLMPVVLAVLVVAMLRDSAGDRSHRGKTLSGRTRPEPRRSY